MAGELYRGASAGAREDLSVRSVDGCAGREQNLNDTVMSSLSGKAQGS
jgi:hypothetical protein